MTYAWINHRPEDRNKQLFHGGRALRKVCWNLGSSKYSQNIWEREQTVKWQGRLMIAWLTQHTINKNRPRRTAKRPQRTEYPGKHTAGYVWLSNQRDVHGKSSQLYTWSNSLQANHCHYRKETLLRCLSAVFCSNQKKLDIRNE